VTAPRPALRRAAPLLTEIVLRVALGLSVVVLVAALAFALTTPPIRPSASGGATGVSAVLHDLERAFLHFDFGVASGWPGRPTVRSMWARGAAADVWMLVGTLALGVGGGFALGLWCAARRGTRRARIVEVAAMVLLCTPVYIVGVGLLFLFHPTFGRWPLPLFFDAAPVPLSPFSAPWELLRTLLVPWLVAAAPLAAMCLRLVLVLVREELAADYIRTAYAKGLPHRRVIRHHAGPFAQAGTASLIGVSAPLVVTNLVLVETVFSVPGFFLNTWRASGHVSRLCRGCVSPDYEMLAALAVWGAVFVVVLGAATDFALARIDPRVRARSSLP
jgi:peptide/nickel transport system permease protein